MMPSKMNLMKNEAMAPDFKASREHFMLLLTANASGDLRMKPMLVFQLQNPWALKIW